MSRYKQFRCNLGPAVLGVLAVLAAGAASSPAVLAQGRGLQAGSQWSVGLGVATIREAYRDFDRKVYPLPAVSYENKWISASVPTFDFKLYSAESLSFRLRARWVGDGYKARHSSALSGMDERKPSVWAGAGVVWQAGFATFSGEVLADTMAKSKGTRARLQIDRRFEVGGFGFTPRLGVEWVDSKYVDYYYGVRQSEARAGRPYYEAGASTNLQLGLGVDYRLVRNHTVFFDVGYTRFGKAVKESPLVDKPNRTTFAVGYIYRF